ncbi:protein kinase domain-containing protein [Pirellulaceae bacterium SH449]
MNRNEQDEIVSVANAQSTLAGFATPLVLPPSHTVETDRAVSNTGILTGATIPKMDRRSDSCESWIGRTVGNYRIVSIIATGGMGTVYQAEQFQPIRRTVALKMIKRGIADDATLRRFHAERQALARVDHPAVAKVFEADTTPDGNPYFAMEFCQGVPVDVFCSSENLALVDRVRLVIRVARAVSSAHQVGIIHRDLKPGNVLVSMCDGQPAVKVIDFGIAKFSDPALAGDDAYHTQVGELVGTPAFMSPEQASSSPIDGRVDVFSLGAILFQLLTGTTPLVPPETALTGIADLLTYIRTFQPDYPSTRFVSLERSTQVRIAESCGLKSPARWLSQVRGELDWITLRAIESDRTRRYATPGDLADDLERYLVGEPVTAVPPSRVYRLKKWTNRNKSWLIPACVAFVALFGFAIYLTGTRWSEHWQAVRETERISMVVKELWEQSNRADTHASSSNETAERGWLEALAALAQADALTKDRLDADLLLEQTGLLRAKIEANQKNLQFVEEIERIRENGLGGSNISSLSSSDPFGRNDTLQGIVDRFEEFGIKMGETEPSRLVDRFAAAPSWLQSRLVESLDFMIYESPVGSGIYLHHQGGRVTVADMVPGGAAYRSGAIQKGDRILKVDQVDLVESFTVQEMLGKTYELLNGAPGTSIELIISRGIAEPVKVSLECTGKEAYWCAEVLRELDPDPWRGELRQAVLALDGGRLKRMHDDDVFEQQPVFSAVQLAGTLFLLGRDSSSIDTLRRIQRKHPESFWVNHYLGLSTAFATVPASPEEGVRYLSAAVSLRPRSLGARMSLAEVLVRLGEHDRAKETIAVAKSLAAASSELGAEWFSRIDKQASVIVEVDANGKVSASTTTIDVTSETRNTELKGQDGSIAFEDFETRARELARSQSRSEALKFLREHGAPFQDDPRLLRVRGAVLIELGDYVAAKVTLSDAARRNPTDAATRFYYGIALQYSGDSSSALHEYQAALQIRPDYEAVRGYLVELQIAMQTP